MLVKRSQFTEFTIARFAKSLKYYACPTLIGDSRLNREVKVTRKYQVTIPESVRSKLGVKIGDRLIVKSENKRIIMESPKRISNPSDALWNLFGKPIDIDATKLIEDSWEKGALPKQKKMSCEEQKEAAD